MSTSLYFNIQVMSIWGGSLKRLPIGLHLSNQIHIQMTISKSSVFCAGMLMQLTCSFQCDQIDIEANL